MLYIALALLLIFIISLASYFFREENEEINEGLDPFHTLIDKK